MYRLVSFCFIFAASVAANAQNSNSTSATKVTAEAPTATATNAPSAASTLNASNPALPITSTISAGMTDLPKNKKLSVSTVLTTSTTTEEFGSATNESGATIEIRPSLRLSKNFSASANLSGQQDYRTANSKILNTQLLLTRDSISLNNDDSLRLSGQLILPTDKEQRQLTSLRVGAGAIVGLQHNMALFHKEAQVSVSENMLKSFHRFDRTAERNSNISYRLRHQAALDVSLNQKWSVGLVGYYQTGFTYDNVLKETYNVGESISYSIDKNFAVSLDHSLAGKLFTADHEFDAKLFDSRHSEISVSLYGTY